MAANTGKLEDNNTVESSDKMKSSEKLSQLLQSLPQELFDRIYDHVFTAPPGIRMMTRKGTTPNPIAKYQIVHPDRRSACPSDNTTFTFQALKNFDPATDAYNLHLLHVDKASRDKFAASFFGGEDVFFMFRDEFAIAEFEKSFQPGHVALIRAGLSEEPTKAEELLIPKACIHRWAWEDPDSDEEEEDEDERGFFPPGVYDVESLMAYEEAMGFN